jgi:hypothetical protein
MEKSTKTKVVYLDENYNFVHFPYLKSFKVLKVLHKFSRFEIQIVKQPRMVKRPIPKL